MTEGAEAKAGNFISTKGKGKTTATGVGAAPKTRSKSQMGVKAMPGANVPASLAVQPGVSGNDNDSGPDKPRMSRVVWSFDPDYVKCGVEPQPTLGLSHRLFLQVTTQPLVVEISRMLFHYRKLHTYSHGPFLDPVFDTNCLRSVSSPIGHSPSRLPHVTPFSLVDNISRGVHPRRRCMSNCSRRFLHGENQ